MPILRFNISQQLILTSQSIHTTMNLFHLILSIVATFSAHLFLARLPKGFTSQASPDGIRCHQCLRHRSLGNHPVLNNR
jgi:hypothetical protein